MLFEIETHNSVPSLGIWRGSKWDRPDNKKIILSQCAFLEDNVCSSIGKYELIDGNQIIHTEIEEYKIKLYKKEELEALLFEAGFKDFRLVKAFKRNTLPNDDDETIIYECRK